MSFVHNMLRLFVVILFSALGTSMAFAVPMNMSEITFAQTDTADFAQPVNVGFAARAPPLAAANAVLTGGVTFMQGSAFTLHCQETVAALFGFDANYTAPNSVVPDGWRPVIGVGAQVNTPRGFTTYRTPVLAP